MAVRDKPWSFWLGIALIVLGTLAVFLFPTLWVATDDRGVGPGSRAGPFFEFDEGSFDSPGERIYLTGADDEGRPIARSGGFGGRMRFVGCADCHGEDGGGRRVTMMMFDFTAPDIRWETLTATDADDGHEDDAHPPYDRESFARALRAGVNPAGERLDRVMPRWEVSDGQVEALVDHLQELSE